MLLLSLALLKTDANCYENTKEGVIRSTLSQRQIYSGDVIS